ncbi:MAG: 1-deoxy-D-xylulose-5-phosphate synthase [Lentisphaeria bacterium]|nr:1-deoxy-D-xylulose-5-phosphate synthase [Lentisphaeria bacterium]
MQKHKILDQIQSPADVKKLDAEKLDRLCYELREEIVDAVSRNGGHLAPNLGVVELTVALHRVFNAPEDKILWDVGHQTYAHKLLTGRRREFPSIRLDGGLSGFPSPQESEYDPFVSGHAGTAISAALGFEAANETLHKEGHVVAVVGDGALICGLSMEALNNVRSTCRNLIIIVNDNKMSISRSVGAIPNYLNRIITGHSYNRFKAFAKMAVKRLPASEEIIGRIQKIEGAAKSLFVPGIFFEELGLRYIGPVNGHRLPELIETFRRIRDFNRPVIVHVITEKGAGRRYAAEHPEKFHGVSSFDPETGESAGKRGGTLNFSAVFGQALCRLAELHPEVVAITAAMRSGTGMTAFSERFPDRFYDVGIAEGHALTFAAGLAANGLRPVVSIYATFLQRGLDSLYHDICLQNLPVILCADRAGVVEDGPTHHGLYDENFALNMPNLCVMIPKNENELAEMLFLAYRMKSPVMIRYPRGGSRINDLAGSPLEYGRAEVVREGGDLALWAVGSELRTALETADLLKSQFGLDCRVVNVRFLKPLDGESLKKDAAAMPLITIENTLAGSGLDMLADRLLVSEKHCGVLHFAWPSDELIPHGSAAVLREKFGLTAQRMVPIIHKRFFADSTEQEQA